jgi:hypothetical protein
LRLSRVRDPDNEVLARTHEHAVNVRELDSRYGSWMEVHELYFGCLGSITSLPSLTVFQKGFDVPDEDFLFWVLAAGN